MDEIREKVSVITVCYNCASDLEKTIQSVSSQDYNDIEYIVIDGGSIDNTQEIIRKYSSVIDKYISEKDDGIYDAMNKGLKMCTGEWVIMMNAGDNFVSGNTLSSVFSKDIPDGKNFLYSDYVMEYADGLKKTFYTDRKKAVVHHQNAIYRLSLHERFGYYIVTHPYIVSDLLFFMAIPEDEFMKLPTPISNVKANGISGGYWVTRQRLCVEHIYGIHSFPYIIMIYCKMKVGGLLRFLHCKK